MGSLTYQINHFLKVNLDLAKLEVRVLGRVVNERRNLALPHLACSETKHKQQRVDDIGLARAVGANDRRERSMKRADFLAACVTLEVVEDEVGEHDSGLGRRRLLHHRDGDCPLLEHNVQRLVHDGVKRLDRLDGVVGFGVLGIHTGGGNVRQGRAVQLRGAGRRRGLGSRRRRRHVQGRRDGRSRRRALARSRRGPLWRISLLELLRLIGIENLTGFCGGRGGRGRRWRLLWPSASPRRWGGSSCGSDRAPTPRLPPRTPGGLWSKVFFVVDRNLGGVGEVVLVVRVDNGLAPRRGASRRPRGCCRRHGGCLWEFSGTIRKN